MPIFKRNNTPGLRLVEDARKEALTHSRGRKGKEIEPGTPQERDLDSRERGTGMDGKQGRAYDTLVERFADRFIEESKDESPERFERWAGFQNHIIRAHMRGDVRVSKFMDDIARKLEGLYGGSWSEDFYRTQKGIGAAIAAIELRRKEFATQGGAEYQEIYLSDYLDANYAIDFLDVRYDTVKGDDQSEQIVIREIQLVQVKNREDLEGWELARAQEAHQRYVDVLMNNKTFDQLLEREGRIQSVEHLAGTAELFMREMESAKGIAEQFLYLRTVFMDTFMELAGLMEEGDVSDTQIEQSIVDAEQSVALMKMLFSVYPGIELLLIDFHRFMGTEEPVKAGRALGDRMRTWARKHPLTLEEARELHPNWQLTKPVDTKETVFTSVFQDGPLAPTIKPLSVQHQKTGGKALTA